MARAVRAAGGVNCLVGAVPVTGDRGACLAQRRWLPCLEPRRDYLPAETGVSSRPGQPGRVARDIDGVVDVVNKFR